MHSRLGAYVAEQRRVRKLTPQQLAALVGYRNVAKGGNRIVAVERGEQTDAALLARVAAALQLDLARVDALAQDDRSAREAAWEAWADEPSSPELRVRVIPAVWCLVQVPLGLSRAGAENYASARAVESGRVHVLVWSRCDEVWCYPDGRRLARTMNVGDVAGPVSTLRGRGNRGFTLG